MIHTASKINNCFASLYFYHSRTLKASSGCLEKFEKIHSIKFCAISGESALADSIMMEEWKRWLPILLHQYSEGNVCNADESSLLFKLLPNRSLVLSKDSYKDGKCSKERYTVLLCTNWSSSHKIKLLVIGNREASRVIGFFIRVSVQERISDCCVLKVWISINCLLHGNGIILHR